MNRKSQEKAEAAEPSKVISADAIGKSGAQGDSDDEEEVFQDVDRVKE